MSSLRESRVPGLAERRRRSAVTNRQIARCILILLCAALLIPLWWMLVTAVKSDHELTAFPPTLWPQRWLWQNFAISVTFIPFFRYLLNTTIVTVFSVLGAVISNPIIAYGFSRVNWPGRDKVFLFVLATVFIPFPVVLVALFDTFAHLHWINTFLPLIVPLFFGHAFWIFLMRQFLLQIPGELSDSARLDGANEFQVFLRVILPLSLPAIGAIAIFAFIAAWNDFLGPLIYLQDSSKYTLAIGLTFFHSTHDVRLNLLMAASTLVILPVVVIFILFQRFFVQGITLGSIR
jgi:multiple sugar transport system permease protein